MKKLFLILLPLILISCATTGKTEKTDSSAEAQKFPWSTFNVKAGEEIKMPVNCGFVCYGKTGFVYEGWDFSIPKEFGKKTLIATLPYTFYFEGQKEEVFYELIIRNVNLKPEIASQEIYSEIAEDTVIGTAAEDNPGIMIRAVTGLDPNLILDSKTFPVSVGEYTYFDASTLMATTPKFLTFMPVSSKDDLIEFWDYPESIKQLADASIQTEKGKSHITRFPNFQIMIKGKLTSYPVPVTTTSTNDIVLRNQFYSFAETEMDYTFDGVPFHFVFYKGFESYLKDEYTLGDDIYLYLYALFGKDGALWFYVRDYTLNSPETMYENRVNAIKAARN